MAFEIPHDLVKELQISLRKEAGLSSYNPEDTTLPDLPSLRECISQLDPSPEHLRCENCKGRLLRGVNSIFCVFCGRQQNKDVPLEPIKFMSTSGCQWLLQSLDLDGSELVGPLVEANESVRGQNTQQNKFPLSELLNLEIRWPSESEKLENRSPSQKLGSFAEVDFDNFFGEANIDIGSFSPEQEFALNRQSDPRGSNAFQSHGNLSLFESVQPSKTVEKSLDKENTGGNDFPGHGNVSLVESVKLSDTVAWSLDKDNDATGSNTFQGHGNINLFANSEPSDTAARSIDKHNDTIADNSIQGQEHLSLFENVKPSESVASSIEDESCDAFSGWDSDFQSADSGAQHKESKSFDPFSGSSSVDLSTQMDLVFGPGKDLFDGKSKDNMMPSASNMNDWFEGNIWSNSNSGVTVQSEQKGSEAMETMNRSSMNIDWIQGDQWQTTSTSNNKIMDEDDSFDSWNAFTSSISMQVPSEKSIIQTMAPPVEKSIEMNDRTIDEDDDFDSWNAFTGSTSAQVPSKQSVNHAVPSSLDQSSEVNLFSGANLQDFDFGSFSEAGSFSGRPSNQNGSAELNIMQPETSFSDRMAGVNARGLESADNRNTTSETDVAEKIMAQMHDLSFMLESNLSLPQKKDQSSSFSKD